MNKLLLIASLCLAFQAHADIFKCNFGDDGAATYSTSTETLLVQVGEGPASTMNQVSLQVKSPGQIDLLASNSTVLMSLNLNVKGSDGNSDVVYPIEAHWLGKNEMWGGCTSNFLHSTGKQ